MAIKEETGGPGTNKKKQPVTPPVTQKTPATPSPKPTTQKPYAVTRDVWEDIKSRNKGRSGSASKIWLMEELEPYMGDIQQGVYGSGVFPGLVPPPMPRQYGSGYGDNGRHGGGGGGGSLPTPPGIKIRTTTGNRLTPYWESEPDYIQGWQPRLTVLGNTSAW